MLKWLDFIIILFFGTLGVHKFIKKDIKMGLIYLFTMGVFGIGWLIDLVKSFKETINAPKQTTEKDKLYLSLIVISIIIIPLFPSSNPELEGVPAFLFLIVLVWVYFSRKNELEKDFEGTKSNRENTNKENIISQLTNEDLKPISVSKLVLKLNEECYYVGKVKLNHFPYNEINNKVGRFYITNKRVVFNSVEFMFDKGIEDITYISDIDTFKKIKNIITIQFGDVGYTLESKDSEVIKIILRKVIKGKLNDTGYVICEYCGMDNKKTNKNCPTCNAPIKRITSSTK